MAHRVVVMYAGKVVEQGDVEAIFENPLHPYTHGLLHSIPKIEGSIERLESVPGLVPNPLRLPTGCLFEPRCSRAMERCREQRPEIKDLGEGRQVSCWLYS
jgi:oligopeptide/dipeptide ABC transporter ATP-binding protein